VLKEYNLGLGKYIEDSMNLKVIESKRENAFENFSAHHNSRTVTLPFASFVMTGDVELDGARYNSYIHRVGMTINTSQGIATRVRAIPITHPYVIDLWAKSKDELQNLKRTFWIAVMDSPVVEVFNRETTGIYRVSLEVEGSVGENIEEAAEDKAGYYNTSINVRLGVWIRVPAEIRIISKVIIEYIESPENYILEVNEYS